MISSLNFEFFFFSLLACSLLLYRSFNFFSSESICSSSDTFYALSDSAALFSVWFSFRSLRQSALKLSKFLYSAETVKLRSSNSLRCSSIFFCISNTSIYFYLALTLSSSCRPEVARDLPSLVPFSLEKPEGSGAESTNPLDCSDLRELFELSLL